MKFALNLCLTYLDNLSINAKNDLSYINSDAEKLQQAIGTLNKELSSLAACRSSLNEEVAQTKKQINEIINANLEKLKKDVKRDLDKLLSNYVLDSAKRLWSDILSIFNRDKNEFEFESKQDAKLFA